jgi:hypothetical protein
MCKHFPWYEIDNNLPTAHCIYEGDCWFWDWEDGRAYEYRKHYEKEELFKST